MATDPSRPPSLGLQRLADQLRTLAEVAETLTFRLLELEERVAAIGAEVPAGPEPRDDSAATDTLTRLLDGEQRLARIESLLAGMEGAASPRPRRPVAPPALQQEWEPGGSPSPSDLPRAA
jgi:hypothetical protein